MNTLVEFQVILTKKVLITDLDNTLFDWVKLWGACFNAMLQKIESISGIPSATLKPQIRSIFQKHGTSEYSFLIEELTILKDRFPNEELIEKFKPAVEAFRDARRINLNLYPTVAEALLKIKGSGALIVGYTESMSFYSNYRARRLGLDGVIDYIFSPKDHDLPENISDIRKYPSSHYEFRFTKSLHTPEGKLKPNSDVLLSIIAQVGAIPQECAYVGDSLHKDIVMAKDVGVTDLYAQYGRAQDTDIYQTLREVTHWSDEEVEREKSIYNRDVSPSITLENSFSEIFNYIQFGGKNG